MAVMVCMQGMSRQHHIGNISCTAHNFWRISIISEGLTTLSVDDTYQQNGIVCSRAKGIFEAGSALSGVPTLMPTASTFSGMSLSFRAARAMNVALR